MYLIPLTKPGDILTHTFQLLEGWLKPIGRAIRRAFASSLFRWNSFSDDEARRLRLSLPGL